MKWSRAWTSESDAGWETHLDTTTLHLTFSGGQNPKNRSFLWRDVCVSWRLKLSYTAEDRLKCLTSGGDSAQHQQVTGNTRLCPLWNQNAMWGFPLKQRQRARRRDAGAEVKSILSSATSLWWWKWCSFTISSCGLSLTAALGGETLWALSLTGGLLKLHWKL